MISIGKPYITEKGDRTELHAPVTISDDTAQRFIEVTSGLPNVSWLTTCDYPPASWSEEGSSMWFAVTADYGKYLCCERSDAFVIAFFWYAMVTGSDISFEAPISKKLYDGLTQKLIPALSGDGYGEIRLDGPLSDEPVWNENGVVCGMSCGADAMYALHIYGGSNAPDDLKITHSSYYHADYLFPYLDPPYDVDKIIEKSEQLYSRRTAEKARVIAGHQGLPLIEVWTNFDRDYYRGGLIYTGMYRFLCCTLALEHLFSAYIIASSGNGHNVQKTSLFVPTQHYEDLLCESCGTESLRYIISDHALRVDKLRKIADDPDFRKYVSVCSNDTEDGKNCGECFGCWKTMIPLDLLGKLDYFGERFDLDRYNKERSSVFEKMIRFSFRPEADAAREVVRQVLDLADETDSDAASMFIGVWDSIKNNG